MKHFVLIILLCFILFACTKDQINTSINLNKNILQLKVGESFVFSVLGEVDANYLWVSNNDFAMKLNDEGFVKALKVGEVTLVVTQEENLSSAKCNIEIVSNFNIFEEPCLDFSKSKQEIFDLEQSFLINKTDVSLSYIKPRHIKSLTYNFLKGKLSTVFLIFNEHSIFEDELRLFLNERYRYIGFTNNCFLYTNRDETIIISQKIINNKNWSLAYLPYKKGVSLNMIIDNY